MTETDIIRNIKNGDASAFKVLVDNHQSMVFRTVLGFVHVKEDAEDLTQEIFLKAYQSLNYFQEKAEFSTWIYRIAVNISLNYIKKKRLRTWLDFTEEKIQGLFNSQDPGSNPEDKVMESERDQFIRKAINQLTYKQRTAFILSKYNELPQKKIAAIMQLSEGAVEQHLQRAKTKLQKKLSGLVGKH